MRLMLFVCGLVLAAAALAAPAQAQNYPWCAYYGNGFSGENCGFVSFEQCLATVRGIGGFCNRNYTYVPPGVTSGAGGVAHHPHYGPRHKRHHYS